MMLEDGTTMMLEDGSTMILEDGTDARIWESKFWESRLGTDLPSIPPPSNR